MDVAAYFDRVAPFYDANTGDPGDVDFYRELAREADGPVLEVGCGTGRIYLELLRDGVDADGIDVSAGMLERLRAKADEAGLEPSVRRADVRTFDAAREYALAIVPFRAFLHLLTVDDQLAALERIHAALAPDGRLALNAFVPDVEFICEQYDEWLERTVTVDGETYTVRSLTTLEDVVSQRVLLRTAVLDDGEVVRESATSITLLSPREFELLFRCSPFTDWAVYGGFEYDRLESAEQEQVWLATA